MARARKLKNIEVLPNINIFGMLFLYDMLQ